MTGRGLSGHQLAPGAYRLVVDADIGRLGDERARAAVHRQRVSEPVEVCVYGAPDCGLCDDAKAILEPRAARLGFQLRTVDITGDEELEARHRTSIPVVEIDGERAFVYHVLAEPARATDRGCTISPRRAGLRNVATALAARFAGRSLLQSQTVSNRLTVGVAARLSRYLQVLTQAKKMGRSSISSQDIAEYTHVNATQIRRDLSGFGKFGKRGVGYNIDALIGEIRRSCGRSGQHNIALIGAGRLGGPSPARRCSPTTASTSPPSSTATRRDRASLGGVRSRASPGCRDTVVEKNIIVGVLAVPADAARPSPTPSSRRTCASSSTTRRRCSPCRPT